MNAGKVVIDIELGTRGFDAQIEEEKRNLDRLVSEYNRLAKISAKDGLDRTKYMRQLNVEIEKTRNKLSTLIKKQNELNRTGVEKMSKGFNSIIQSTGKWLLAIFSVRGAYSLIRQAMSTVLQYNETLANQLESVKYTLAMAIEPVISKIVNLIYTLMQYLQYIIKVWTGKDIFANANKSLKGANKSAKNLQKTMLGFDTANVLNNNDSGGEGTGGGVNPITALGDGEVPGWIKWIADNKKTILDFFIQLGTLIGLIKLGKLITNLGDLFKVLKNTEQLKIFGIVGGVALTLVGIYQTIKSIIDFVKNPTWENFSNILKGISLILVGISVVMIAINAANPVGWIILAIGLVTTLVTLIIKNWDMIKGWFSKAASWIDANVIKPIKDKFNSLPGWMKTLIKGIVNTAITLINNLIRGLNTMLIPLRAIILAVGKVMGKSWSLSTIKIPTIPKLAVGGVISMPGKGVYRGGANIGERGAEGVIPLTNDQSLQMIADAIAQKMNITLDITNKIDSRILNRQLEQVKANNNFARNGA